MPKLSLKNLIFVLTVPSVIIFDQWTKTLVLKNFFYGESVPILNDFFNLTYVRNKGAAFGFLAGADDAFRVPFFMIIPVVALGIIFMVFRQLPPQSRFMSSALALVSGGAIGNFIDRIQLGYVVDFLDFYWGVNHFPAFNVADSAICVGVGMMMLDLVIHKEEPSAKSTSKTSSRGKDSDASSSV